MENKYKKPSKVSDINVISFIQNLNKNQKKAFI